MFFSYHASFIPNSVVLFLFLAVFLILKLNNCKKTNNSRASPFLVAVIKAWLAAWFYNLLLLLSGDVELNLGPKCNYRTAFSICHWNLNSISAHNYAKVFFSLRLILQFVSLILFVYQKYTLILVLLLMITIWKFLGTP